MATDDSETEQTERDTATGALAIILPLAWGIPAWAGAEVLLASMVMVIFSLAGWWTVRARKRRRDDGAKIGVQDSMAIGAGGHEDAVDRPQRATMDSGLLRSVPSEHAPSPENVFFASDGDLLPRSCPQCERVFPNVFDVCPFDSVRLRDEAPRKAGVEPSRQLPRRRCPSCERRFELTALYCYHDGLQLSRDNEDIAEHATAFRICRNCGFETKDGDEHTCPRDEQPLILLDPAERSPVAPAFPFNRCRRCGHVGTADETQCPVDGALMLPELSVRLTALPPTGYGARRRICTECGAQFGDHCNYCAFDGTRLSELN